MNEHTGAIILPYRGVMPRIDSTAYIAPGVVVVGDVVIGAKTSVWFGCVIRGDMNVIRIGAHTNIQDGTVVHVSADGKGTFIGDYATIGHMALIHDCVVESRSFVGMRAVMMDGSAVETGGVLAAGSLLASGKKVSAGQIWAGVPAKYWRDLTLEETKNFDARAEEYVELAGKYG